MSITHTIQPDRSLVWFRCSDALVLDDFDAAFQAVLADPAFSGTYDRLWDLRTAARILEPEEIRGLVGLYRRYRDAVGGRRTAILVASDAYFGMARMFAAIVDNPDVQFRVFREEADALAWAQGGRSVA